MSSNRRMSNPGALAMDVHGHDVHERWQRPQLISQTQTLSFSRNILDDNETAQVVDVARLDVMLPTGSDTRRPSGTARPFVPTLDLLSLNFSSSYHLTPIRGTLSDSAAPELANSYERACHDIDWSNNGHSTQRGRVRSHSDPAFLISSSLQLDRQPPFRALKSGGGLPHVNDFSRVFSVVSSDSFRSIDDCSDDEAELECLQERIAEMANSILRSQDLFDIKLLGAIDTILDEAMTTFDTDFEHHLESVRQTIRSGCDETAPLYRAANGTPKKPNTPRKAKQLPFTTSLVGKSRPPTASSTVSPAKTSSGSWLRKRRNLFRTISGS
eukprot:TRINITY_DN9896_c0_g1_i1.p1 TRINITY_DN9896_c0_g1~~TRINITY_DN9896_c0_g1_i1.p1  ORF type:complete len:327 (-),score=37.54 TRINITY_DN9896_c0_g1_i1:67-1047(-)